MAGGCYVQRHDGLPSNRAVILTDRGIPPPGLLDFLRLQDSAYECGEIARSEDYRLVRAVRP
jgi:hypothetical protein